MDLDSALMITSVLGLMLAPFWAKWWNVVLKKVGASRHQRIAGVLILSLATFLVAHVGPWVLMAAIHGTISSNLAEPRLPSFMLIMFGPGVIIQVVAALSFTLPREANSD